MTKTNNDARPMNNNRASNMGGNGMRGLIMAVALVGTLAMGCVGGAVCSAGIGKAPAMAPGATHATVAKIAATRLSVNQAAHAASKVVTPRQAVKAAPKVEVRKAAQTDQKAEAKNATQAPAAKKAEAKRPAVDTAPEEL
jgi:hypothetical protein